MVASCFLETSPVQKLIVRLAEHFALLIGLALTCSSKAGAPLCLSRWWQSGGEHRQAGQSRVAQGKVGFKSGNVLKAAVAVPVS